MALTSLYTGISGMDASGTALSVIGDNIANMNTYGFKASRVSFGDVLSSSLTSGTSNSQVGRGVLLSGVTPSFSQGSFETTGNALDMAIDGDGFFIVKDNAGTFYTRVGEFRLQKDGTMVNTDGLAAQGFMYTAAGIPTGVVSDISVSATTSSTRPTANFTVSANLDASAVIVDTEKVLFGASDNLDSGEANVVIGTGAGEFDPADPDAGNASYSDTVTVYDQTGTAQTATVYFIKTAADTWSWYAYDDPTGAATADGTGIIAFTAGATTSTGVATFNFVAGSPQSISFDFSNISTAAAANSTTPVEDGYTLTADNAADVANFSTAVTVFDSLGNSRVVTVYFKKTREIASGNQWNWYAILDAANSSTGVATIQSSVSGELMQFDNTGSLTTSDSSDVNFNFGGGAASDQIIKLNFTNFTQYASASETIFQSQDGFPAGSLTTMSISQEGVISGIFTNGQIKPIAKLAMAKFTAPTALTKYGRNLFSESFDSGQAIIGTANQAGLGRIMANSLELSNVDLAREFVNMISAQRGFQANSRVITATDQLLQELVSMVR